MSPPSGPYPVHHDPQPQPGRAALTGATGFLGSAVLAALDARGHETAALTRTAPQPTRPSPRTPSGRAATPSNAATTLVVGDLADDRALAELCSDARILVHAASYVGSDPERQRETNVRGTRALMAAARRAGVQRIVYLSTAGVYGGALGPGLREDEAVVRPRSSLSASRRDAEDVVLEQGGIVIRPHLVHGAGDRWFLSQVLTVMSGLGAWIGGPDVTLSVVGRQRLGEMVAAAALHATPGTIYHAAERPPTRIRELVEPVFARAQVPLPRRTLSPAQTAELLKPKGITREQVDLIGTDSWFRCDRIWDLLDQQPGALAGRPPTPEDISWYSDFASAHTT
ncbi:NAD-dependent epimerase/dehydratase family protein [Luteimicrobium sp. DT211]|uniref:NAD-dependent epimerase/dehydratase family protein n=1 Tax=Luteimicrobium sp. DT211 TaxID=3393412 RepID=UPI003CF8E0B4